MQQFLMCEPKYFGVEYSINPWMNGNVGKVNYELANEQWLDLYEYISTKAKVSLIEPQPYLPDMVFTANAGLLYKKKIIISKFSNDERDGESFWFYDWFRQNGFEVILSNIKFEGAGDALFERYKYRYKPVLWMGHGFRSKSKAKNEVINFLDKDYDIVSLKLVDSRFYHLDTCFCPLPYGYLMYYPKAFDADSQKIIKTLIPHHYLIEVSEEDALRFCCNAVSLENDIIMNGISRELQIKLMSCGFQPVIIDMSQFILAGGSCKCLTLKLDESYDN